MEKKNDCFIIITGGMEFLFIFFWVDFFLVIYSYNIFYCQFFLMSLLIVVILLSNFLQWFIFRVQAILYSSHVFWFLFSIVSVVKAPDN